MLASNPLRPVPDVRAAGRKHKVDHCYPVLANVGNCKDCEGKDMHIINDVSDSGLVLSFSAAAGMPDWCHARWKTDFFATHRVDSPGAISPLCRSLQWQSQSL
jgi:hypothetical protein